MKRECFISHCSDDVEIIKKLQDTFDCYFDNKNFSFFNTSFEENSTKAGEHLNLSLRKALKKAKLMIAIITNNYVRSTICLAELSSYWLMGKTVIPMVFCEEGQKLLKEDFSFGSELIYIDLVNIKNKNSVEQTAKKMVNSLWNYGFKCKNKQDAIKSFTEIFYNSHQSQIGRPYIGIDINTYNKVNRYCSDYGIIGFQNTGLTGDEWNEKLSRYRDVFILATTGAGLINVLVSKYIPNALSKGTHFHILIPNRYSDFIKDVAEIESPNNSEEIRERFSNEFQNVILNLKNCLLNNSNSVGTIDISCTYTLLRQTIVLATDDKKDKIWGWLSLTIPPSRTVDGTPSLEFTGEKINNSSLATKIYNHVTSIWEISKRRGSFFQLFPDSRLDYFFLEKDSAELYWNTLYNKAKENTQRRTEGLELIEVAAQHPLTNVGTPDVEFSKRLDRAIILYKELRNKKYMVNIYVPGSIHYPDSCSLSDAGINYLLEKGIPKEDLLGEADNFRYKKEQGVYNSADECYVASQIFINGHYHRLHCICSPNQMLRKQLFYIHFGVLPFFYTVNTENLAHNTIYELFHSIPDVIYNDHTWQDEKSINGTRTRQERNPKYH